MRWTQFCLLVILTTFQNVRGHGNIEAFLAHVGLRATWRDGKLQPPVARGVPDDDINTWPSPDQVLDLGKRLKGDVVLPGSLSYPRTTINKGNTRFNSRFGAVVLPETVYDVREAVLFARKYGIRPTVKSSGHDYLGRSGGHHTLSINLRRMRAFRVNRNDPTSDTGASVTVEPGNNWGDIYEKVDKEGFVVVGGSAQTVSPGGYTQGGGHSPISRRYGLAVDNTIGFTIVTPDGNIVTLTNGHGTIIKPDGSVVETTDDELFWAVRGGGGGTFGVVTSFTYKLHPAPAGGFVQYIIAYPIVHPLFGRVGAKVLDFWSEYFADQLDHNWGGYIITSNADIEQNNMLNLNMSKDHDFPWFNGSIFATFLHAGGWEAALPMIKHFSTFHTEWMFYQFAINHTSFWAYEKGVNDPVGYRNYIINRLIQRKDLEPESGLSDTLANIINYSQTIGCTWVLLGGEMNASSPESASVSPYLKSSRGSCSCGIGWASENEDKILIPRMQEYGRELYQVGTGVYFNEPDYYLENWKEEYWGSMERYNKLLAVKKRVDPDNMLWCYHCVGSDQYPADRESLSVLVSNAHFAGGNNLLAPMIGLLLFFVMHNA